MKYCKNCILPDTRPNIKIQVDGICNSSKCRPHKSRINWKSREREFFTLVKKIKKKSMTYDCIIPVSGGKDSTWQVITALKYKLKPLCITWKTPQRTIIGQKNLDNLIKLNVDHVDFSLNPEVEKKLIYKSFYHEGSPALPMHMAIHNIPKLFAEKFKIPLILWGENSAYEYGSSDKNLKGSNLSKKWRKEFGNIPKNFKKIGLNFSKKDLFPYYSHLNKKNKYKEIFLGHYFYWDPLKIYKISKKYGFKKSKSPKVGFYNFADIDDQSIITIHHWMKWYKFGISRLWDNLSIEIREGRISRKNAISKLKNDKNNPVKDIKYFCKYLDITEKKFYQIAEKFRNKKIWYKNRYNKWQIKNFLVKNYKWD